MRQASCPACGRLLDLDVLKCSEKRRGRKAHTDASPALASMPAHVVAQRAWRCPSCDAVVATDLLNATGARVSAKVSAPAPAPAPAKPR